MDNFKRKLCAKISEKLNKLQLDTEDKNSLVSTARATIDEVMLLASTIIKPSRSILTEQEFVTVYKAICLNQDAEKVKKIVGEEQFDEFQSRKPFYIERYKFRFYTLLSEVQKQMSED